MHEDDRAVATAQWCLPATLAAMARACDGVRAFAAEQGMEAQGCADVWLAVAEAVADAVAGDPPGNLFIDVATDGEWLSVLIEGEHPFPLAVGELRLPLVAALADRVEWGAKSGGSHIIMEFPMGDGAGRRGPVLRLVPPPVAADERRAAEPLGARPLPRHGRKPTTARTRHPARARPPRRP